MLRIWMTQQNHTRTVTMTSSGGRKRGLIIPMKLAWNQIRNGNWNDLDIKGNLNETEINVDSGAIASTFV